MTAVTMGTLAERGALIIGDGYRTKRAELAGSGFRVLRVGDVLEGRVAARGPDFVAESFRPQIGAKAAQAGDVLVTTKGTVGRVAIMPALAEEVVYSPQLCFFRVIDRDVVDPRFLRYWFASEAFREQASHRANNTDMAAYINLADIRSLEVNLPAVSTQRALAEVLGALDDKIAANSRRGCAAGELASALYDSRVAGAEMVPMSSVLQPVLGGTPSRTRDDYWKGAVPWASAKDITSAPMDVLAGTQECITDLAVAQTKAKPLPAGSVILTARGTVGAVARLAVAASINQSCYGFVPGTLSPAVLYFAVKRAADRVGELAHGSVFDTITMATLDHLYVPDPAYSEMAALEAQVRPLLALVEGSVAESEALAHLRDALLPTLMSGRLRVKDAERLVEGEV